MEKTQNKNNSMIATICKSDHAYGILKWIIISIINAYFTNNPDLNERYGDLVKKYIDLLRDNDEIFNEFCDTLNLTKDLDKDLNIDTKRDVLKCEKLLTNLVLADIEGIKHLFNLFIDELSNKHIIAVLNKD